MRFCPKRLFWNGTKIVIPQNRKRIFLDQMKKFIEWLQNAEEESEEESDEED